MTRQGRLDPPAALHDGDDLLLHGWLGWHGSLADEKERAGLKGGSGAGVQVGTACDC